MSLEITYYIQGNNKNMYGGAISSETRTASASSAQSGATPSNAEIIRIASTANNRFAYGPDPTATANAGADGHFIGAGAVIDIAAVSGWKIAAITAS